MLPTLGRLLVLKALGRRLLLRLRLLLLRLRLLLPRLWHRLMPMLRLRLLQVLGGISWPVLQLLLLPVLGRVLWPVMQLRLLPVLRLPVLRLFLLAVLLLLTVLRLLLFTVLGRLWHVLGLLIGRLLWPEPGLLNDFIES